MGIVLFDEKEKCCGCGACLNVCPKNAISMKPDKEGFLYPFIDKGRCIECGLCKKSCNYQEVNYLQEPISAYAAVNKNEEQLFKSASGGVFSAIATQFLKEGGVVYGATLEFNDGYVNPHHIEVTSIDELYKLQGSKYVQSMIDDCYKKAQIHLENGKKVLFSGTPCQIAGLYGYLKKYYENLWTIDVICHGVPNAQFFNDFINNESKKKNASVIGYCFRDKTKGWGLNGRIDFKYPSGKVKSFYTLARLSSYYTFFLNGDIYRENCYSCPYARKERVSDITIGDYWGIRKEQSELLNKEEYDENKGISCALVNTEKGKKLFEGMGKWICLDKSSYEKISRGNGQLKKPSDESKIRNYILNMYVTEGYEKLDKWYKRKNRKKLIAYRMYRMIPTKLRLKIKYIALNFKTKL
ncbi:Coenzyme F420 hydrogenase/dehydrogenase, beta subunit C-terminal domain [Clostridium sp. MSJ-8]|uniref:Coenzyme F420 hydrogenase/dehydrogenase, beta subunit C-terminal domain n=1 Tax=Clostridium sp. MSJ-8 TaxID=2841510 RepID=UPI001C0EE94C|nr:Coenzyme F420 hydrogenase/dehydrogenase, beta subunit C-terminal domain [Clostridium sp. MSJ-8]MBU5487425.1 Coenzyme F420 hydrogenase/dehydrogenase, beta subunit C-terminal domain [Clostridium sp. MSJ-8]